MRKKIDRISTTLIKILKARGLEARLSEYRIFGAWEKAVGRVIARHAQPQGVRGKRLNLLVDSSAWMQQLSLLKPEIIEKVNACLGKNDIKEISLKLGEVRASEDSSVDKPQLPDLRAEERAAIDQVVREISDVETRESLRQLMEKDYRSRKGRK